MLQLPTVSMRDAERDPDRASRLVRQAFEEWGFVAVRDHQVPASSIQDCYEQAGSFFALPQETKDRYHVRGGAGQRGYTPFASETGKGASAPDLKEFWHVGREPAPAGASSEAYPDNVWPEELPAFRPALLTLYRQLEELGNQLLVLVARSLGLPSNDLVDRVRDGNSILRPLHYPPIENAAGAVRAAAHEDINVLTLLVGSEEPGLEILARTGEWMPVATLEGTIVCNVGDMLQRLTNRVLRSTTHRVVNPPPPWSERSRHSIPFFLHFAADVRIEALPGCLGEREPEPPITAHEYLEQRLRELGLRD